MCVFKTFPGNMVNYEVETLVQYTEKIFDLVFLFPEVLCLCAVLSVQSQWTTR